MYILNHLPRDVMAKFLDWGVLEMDEMIYPMLTKIVHALQSLKIQL